MARIYRKQQHVESTGTVRPARIYHYGVVETIDESGARSLAAGYLGPVIATPFGVLYRGEITATQTAYNQWDADVEYIQRPKDIGTWSADIDFTGGSEHILTSLSTVASYPVSTAPNFRQFIGVEPDEVKGTDISVLLICLVGNGD